MTDRERQLVAALQVAEIFIEAELDCRKYSYSPLTAGSNPEDREYIESAENALAVVQHAIKSGGTK